MNETPTILPVICTEHAVRQAIGRAAVPDRHWPGVIRTEVISALREGRISCSRPRWLARDRERRRTPAGSGTVRYASNPERSRCYVLRKRYAHDLGGPAWIVVTVLTPIKVAA